MSCYYLSNLQEHNLSATTIAKQDPLLVDISSLDGTQCILVALRQGPSKENKIFIIIIKHTREDLTVSIAYSRFRSGGASSASPPPQHIHKSSALDRFTPNPCGAQIKGRAHINLPLATPMNVNENNGFEILFSWGHCS